jgi:hypothetical protein
MPFAITTSRLSFLALMARIERFKQIQRSADFV